MDVLHQTLALGELDDFVLPKMHAYVPDASTSYWSPLVPLIILYTATEWYKYT